jgi:hypothetical protein
MWFIRVIASTFTPDHFLNTVLHLEKSTVVKLYLCIFYLEYFSKKTLTSLRLDDGTQQRSELASSARRTTRAYYSAEKLRVRWGSSSVSVNRCLHFAATDVRGPTAHAAVKPVRADENTRA